MLALLPLLIAGRAEAFTRSAITAIGTSYIYRSNTVRNEAVSGSFTLTSAEKLQAIYIDALDLRNNVVSSAQGSFSVDAKNGKGTFSAALGDFAAVSFRVRFIVRTGANSPLTISSPVFPWRSGAFLVN